MYPVIDIVAPSRRENHSALPDAPVVPEPPPRRSVASRVAGLLRTLARHELRVANRIDPGCEVRPVAGLG